MELPNKLPINRVNKFFSQEDFDLEISFGREAIEGDGNFVVILYRVDREMTASDDVYGEASEDDIRFLPPLELRVLPILAPSENKAYNNGHLRHNQDGPLTFAIYEAQLAELDAELMYGDYIGYQVDETDIRYFSVVQDGRKNYDNTHTIMGYKGACRTVVCAPVDRNEFKGV